MSALQNNEAKWMDWCFERAAYNVKNVLVSAGLDCQW